MWVSRFLLSAYLNQKASKPRRVFKVLGLTGQARSVRCLKERTIYTKPSAIRRMAGAANADTALGDIVDCAVNLL